MITPSGMTPGSASSAQQVTASPGRHRELDGLRGIAVSAVLLRHYFYVYDVYFDTGVTTAVRFSRGFYGVHLFFMISGFVILLTARRATRPRDFVIARGTRLYPTYWACLTISWVLIALSGFTYLARSGSEIAVNYSMLQRLLRVREVDGAYWSLSVELVFYGLIFLVLLVRRGVTDRDVARLMLGWCAISAAVGVGSHLNPDSSLWHAMSIATGAQYAPLFGIGMFGLLDRARGRIGLGSVTCLVMGGAVTFLYVGVEGAMIVGGLGILFLAVVLRPRVGFLRWRPLLFIGEISYPLYLIHQNVGYWVIHHLYPAVARDVASLAAIPVVILLAWGVHVSIETTVSRRARRWLTERFS